MRRVGVDQIGTIPEHQSDYKRIRIEAQELCSIEDEDRICSKFIYSLPQPYSHEVDREWRRSQPSDWHLWKKSSISAPATRATTLK